MKNNAREFVLKKQRKRVCSQLYTLKTTQESFLTVDFQIMLLETLFSIIATNVDTSYAMHMNLKGWKQIIPAFIINAKHHSRSQTTKHFSWESELGDKICGSGGTKQGTRIK